MCTMRETVIEVTSAQLSGDWAAVRGDDGSRVVFVQAGHADQLDLFCSLGTKACPVFAALTGLAPAPAA